MRFRRCVRGTLISVAYFGMLLPRVSAVEPHRPSGSPQRMRVPHVRDVVLDPRGRLHGMVFNKLAQPEPGRVIGLFSNGRLIQQTTSDQNGRFAFPGLRGGEYQVGTMDRRVVCRAWTAAAAPPASQLTVVFVSDGDAARGQQPIDELFIFHPAVMGAMLAAAIAIPIAIHNSGDDLPSGS